MRSQQPHAFVMQTAATRGRVSVRSAGAHTKQVRPRLPPLLRVYSECVLFSIAQVRIVLWS